MINEVNFCATQVNFFRIISKKPLKFMFNNIIFCMKSGIYINISNEIQIHIKTDYHKLHTKYKVFVFIIII